MNSEINEREMVRLTNREYDILRLVADEYSNREIALRLSITVGTVESHRKNLFLKLRAKNMAGLIRRAFDNKILFPRT